VIASPDFRAEAVQSNTKDPDIRLRIAGQNEILV
jgi:hypothetical protein